MKELNSLTTKSLSPGEMLRLQREMEAKTRAYSQVAVALQQGVVFGDQVKRLTDLIAGTPEQRQQAETELMLTRLLQVHTKLSDMGMDAIRRIR